MTLTPSEIGQMLGRLGKGKTSAAKKIAAQANWKKAEAVLRKTRWKKKAGKGVI